MLTSTAQGDESSGRHDGPLADWEVPLTASRPGRHIAQLYTEHEFLARAVSRFVGDGLARGEGMLVIASPLHWRLVSRRLETLGLDVQSFQRDAQLRVRDAASMLETFMVDGRPRREPFRAVIGAELDALRASGHARARTFGEMVDLLRRGDLESAVELETLWTELVTERRISLLCGYSVDALDPRSYRGLVQKVAANHSDLIPVEDYARLERAVERAYVEVFGSRRDAKALREAFLQHFSPPAAMPEAEAAILALQTFVPGSADQLISSARRHYHAA